MSEIQADLVDNTSQRAPCVLVLDGSGSMEGAAINALNEGLKVLEAELKNDDVAAQRVQLQVIRIGDDSEVQVVQDWCDAMDFSAPVITANGTTPLGEGMLQALGNIEAQKDKYKANNIKYNRPWLFAITDGVPTDLNWEDAAAQCRDAESEDKVVIFCIGTADADMEALKQFSTRSPMLLEGLQFKELFMWLSQSASAASQTTQGNEVQLPAVGWGTVST